ncbi:variable surface lipoprotein [Mycoplasmopsis bovis]|uniref:variable surface lipoprotein n=3 Tax=Mycoplasmopsis bovis TaxID=28903 RepID=UPI001093DB9F|nr:variable surface lipoprotein [Mycoplasmopsis bovis]QCA30393.1 variable surface lipoprotein [Mycoplasmopsis bovis]
MKKSKFLLLGSVASLASIPFVAAKCGETKEEKKPEADKPKLSETLKSITGNDLGKVQVAEQDKSNKEKIEAAIKEAIVTKVPTLKDKELKLNADLSKKSVTVSAKDFEGEVTLKFEIEAKSAAKPKLSETLKSITGNDLGKVQVAEQDKSNKEKIEAAIKEAIVAKVPTLKDKELKLNADLSKKSVTVSAKDFEGEVTLKFEIEAKSVAKPKLSETLKSITGNDLGKVQVAEQDKSNKEKIEAAIKEAIVAKVPTLKDKELKLNADLSKKSVTVSAKDFEGEVTLKFEIEAKSDEDKIKKEKIEKEKAVAERNKLNDSITVREELLPENKGTIWTIYNSKGENYLPISGFKFGEEAKETKANK